MGPVPWLADNMEQIFHESKGPILLTWSDQSFMKIAHRAVIWANIDPDQSCHMVSLGRNEFMYVPWKVKYTHYSFGVFSFVLEKELPWSSSSLLDCQLQMYQVVLLSPAFFLYIYILILLSPAVGSMCHPFIVSHSMRVSPPHFFPLNHTWCTWGPKLSIPFYFVFGYIMISSHWTHGLCSHIL